MQRGQIPILKSVSGLTAGSSRLSASPGALLKGRLVPARACGQDAPLSGNHTRTSIEAEAVSNLQS